MSFVLKPLKVGNHKVAAVTVMLFRGFCSPVTPIVNLPGLGDIQGSIKKSGFTQQSVLTFLGVKYAENPSGERRFKAPVPAEPWTGIRDVKEFGTPCPVFRNTKNLTPEQITADLEDCLNLCVYTKDLTGNKPVMFYVHGGGFFDGEACMHPGDYLLERDIVLVVPQYRLGPLGFLATKSDTIPGNAGVLDLLLALEWVQKYISQFGGDPDQVTAFAQSAGCAIVSAMTYSPIVPDKLFNKVILQSGGSMATWSWDNNPERNARDIARIAGENHTGPLEDVEKSFLKMDVQTLTKAFTTHMLTGTPNGINTIGGHRLTIGGPTNFLPINPYEAMKNGGGRKDLPMIAGVVKHDGSFSLTNMYDIFLYIFGNLDNKQYNSFKMIDLINRILGVEDVNGLLTGFLTKQLFTQEEIVNGDFREMAFGLMDLSGVAVIKGPALRAAQANANFNPNQTYLYSFDYKGEFTRWGYGEDTSIYPFEGGVHHSDDNIYLFPFPENMSKLNENDKKIAMKLVDLWTSFATTGVPKADGVPEWKPVTRVSGPYLHIDTNCTIGQDFLDEFSISVDDERRRKAALDTSFGKINQSTKSKDII